MIKRVDMGNFMLHKTITEIRRYNLEQNLVVCQIIEIDSKVSKIKRKK